MMDYKNEILNISKEIDTKFIHFDEPRSEAPMPTQASSEFITNKQQGDWAEDVIFRAVNENSGNIVAIRYGKSDDLIAGDPGFEEFYHDYQTELDTIGKRPDLLLFKKADFEEKWGYDISHCKDSEIDDYVRKVIAGIEVRSSSFLINKYNAEAEKLVSESTDSAISIKNRILRDYNDILSEKKPELIRILETLDETTVSSLQFRVPTWSSSQRLQELKTLFKDLKSNLNKIQKRNTLSITPKVEDLKVVRKWIMTYNVPHYYVQVFFDRVYGISFKYILEVISNPDNEGKKFSVEQDAKNQNKTTIKIPSQDGICLAEAVKEPNHSSVRKELSKGRLLFYVTFDGGEAILDKENFDELFNCNL